MSDEVGEATVGDVKKRPTPFEGEKVMSIPVTRDEREPRFRHKVHYARRSSGEAAESRCTAGYSQAGFLVNPKVKYYEPLGLHFHGAYQLTKSGTPDKPIVIRAAGDGEAVFDGDGVYRLFDVIYADYTHIEGLTIKNCDIAVMAGLKFAHGCQGLVVRNCRMEDVGCGVNAQYGGSTNFYIADNIILGKKISLPGWKDKWADESLGAPLVSFIGIDINGVDTRSAITTWRISMTASTSPSRAPRSAKTGRYAPSTSITMICT